MGLTTGRFPQYLWNICAVYNATNIAILHDMRFEAKTPGVGREETPPSAKSVLLHRVLIARR
jgi:hypothetical protein